MSLTPACPVAYETAAHAGRVGESGLEPIRREHARTLLLAAKEDLGQLSFSGSPLPYEVPRRFRTPDRESARRAGARARGVGKYLPTVERNRGK